MADITIESLTEGTLNGKGVFDRLMVATKAHLDDQFKLGRIKGPEYSQVYLGQLQAAMQLALTFVTEQQKINLEAQLLTQQVELTKAQVLKAQAEVLVAQQEVETAKATVELTKAQVLKIEAENVLIPKQGLHLDAQTRLVNQQADNAVGDLDLTTANTAHIKQTTTNLIKELELTTANTDHVKQTTTNLIKELELTTANVAHVLQTNVNLVKELDNMTKQGDLLTAQKGQITQAVLNLTAEGLNIPKQGEQIDAQVCLLKSQFDNTVQTTARVAQETDLMAQKVTTEKAQTMGMSVDENSVLGRQKALYLAQADGFKRDAEQKAAKILIDTWNTRRMTDDATIAGQSASGGVDNGLGDNNIGKMVGKLLSGVGA